MEIKWMVLLYWFYRPVLFCFYFCVQDQSHCSYAVLNWPKLYFRFSEAREVSQSLEIYWMRGKREKEPFEALEECWRHPCCDSNRAQGSILPSVSPEGQSPMNRWADGAQWRLLLWGAGSPYSALGQLVLITLYHRIQRAITWRFNYHFFTQFS